MMSKEVNERLKRDTPHVPFRQNEEEKIREKGAKSGAGRRERTQGRDERSNGIEIRIADAFAIIKPTAPLRLAKHEARNNTFFFLNPCAK
jgi:hypothetical protein